MISLESPSLVACWIPAWYPLSISTLFRALLMFFLGGGGGGVYCDNWVGLASLTSMCHALQHVRFLFFENFWDSDVII